MAIVITNGSTITSVNQGSTAATAPTVSSVNLTVTDSIGNLIYPSDPQKRILGYRQIVADQTLTAPASPTNIVGLTVPFIAPGNRKVEVEVSYEDVSQSGGANQYVLLYVYEGATLIVRSGALTNQNWQATVGIPKLCVMPSAGLHTYQVKGSAASGNLTIYAGTSPASVTVRLA